MVRLIKSDLYKLFRMKSFYILGLIAAVLTVLNIFLLNFADRMQYALYGIEDMFISPYTGVYSFGVGLPTATLFIIILVSMFVQSEFKFGTMKNIVAAGYDRVCVYLSKFVATIFISLVYTLLCGLVAFISGCCIAGVGEFTRATFLDLLEILGLCLLTQISMQSIFQMIGFLARNTGWAIGLNIAIYAFLPVCFRFIDLLVNNWLADAIAPIEWLSSWLKIENFSVSKYWPANYMEEFTGIDYLHMDFFREVLITGIIVCVVYIAISSLLGLTVFKKRDID